MANVFVVFSKILKTKDMKSYMLIDQGTCEQMDRGTAFSVNEILEENIDILMNMVTELIIAELNRSKKDHKYVNTENFIILIPVNEDHFNNLKDDHKNYTEFRSNFEEEIFTRTTVKNPTVIFHMENDFSRIIIRKEKVFSLIVPSYEDITFPYPKELVVEAEKVPGLIGTIFSSA